MKSFSLLLALVFSNVLLTNLYASEFSKAPDTKVSCVAACSDGQTMQYSTYLMFAESVATNYCAQVGASLSSLKCREIKTGTY